MNTGRTHFKKGIIPWNKNKKGVYSKNTLEIMAAKKRGVKHPHTKEWNKKIGKSQKGDKGNNWGKRGRESNSYLNGLTPLFLQIRHCFKSRQFSDDCYVRDNFTCQKCGERGGKLCVHHINSFSNIIEGNNIKSLKEAESCVELWNINNGIVFCNKDHGDFHKKFGFKNNNREQLLNFLQN